MPIEKVKHNHTFKLYYNDFLWKVKLIFPKLTNKNKKLLRDNDDKVLKPINDWLLNNIVGDYRLLKSWRIVKSHTSNIVNKKSKVKNDIINYCHFTVFLNNEIDYFNLINTFQQFVDTTYSPANKSHEDAIREGNILDIRNKLYFGAYRYKISFWNGGWRRKYFIDASSRDLLTKYIHTHLHNDSKDDIDQDYYIIEFNNTLYLKNKDDFTMVKLSLGDYIKKITIVVLPTEIVSSLII